MPCEFDHVFICVSRGGEEARELAAFGLIEGPANKHQGQGTACRRFFFANAYLELLWVSNAAEAQTEQTRPTYLWERWTDRGNGSCPIGFGFRPKAQGDLSAPFRSWGYRPGYLPAPLSLHVATNASMLTEPMLFYLPFLRLGPRQPLQPQGAGLHEVTRVGLASPHLGALSPEMTAVRDAGLVQFHAGPEYLVELGFDGETKNQQADFRPSLPLVFRW